MPARASTFFVTSTGPVSISAGSEPILAKARMRARGRSPAASPASREPISTAAAPSTMPDELPAWWTWSTASTSGWASTATASKPPIWPIWTKEGLSWPSDCMSVEGRMCSSRSSRVMPLMSRTGTTESLNRPSAQDFAERFCDSTA